MKLNNAMELAKQQRRGITRGSWLKQSLWLIPSNTTLCMIMMSGDEMLSKRWNPKAEDITADDWLVYG